MIMFLFICYMSASYKSISCLNGVNYHTSTVSKYTNQIRHQEVWSEVNDSIILNCSLRVYHDQHVVWHRKYDKMGVHVLTIESETFISDLRIRPIKQTLYIENDKNENKNYYENQNNIKLTWNLEIRRLKKEDSAFYYCVVNSENSYGQVYKLNVLSNLKILNQTEISLESYLKNDNNINYMILICQYNNVAKSSNEQIRWYFNKYRIRNVNELRRIRYTDSNSTKLIASDFDVIENRNYTLNITTSKLLIKNLDQKSLQMLGKYKCQVKGISKSTRIYSKNYIRQNDSLILLQQNEKHLNQLQEGNFLLEESPSYSSSASSNIHSSFLVLLTLPQFFALSFILIFNCGLVFLLKQIIILQGNF